MVMQILGSQRLHQPSDRPPGFVRELPESLRCTRKTGKHRRHSTTHLRSGAPPLWSVTDDMGETRRSTDVGGRTSVTDANDSFDFAIATSSAGVQVGLYNTMTSGRGSTQRFYWVP